MLDLNKKTGDSFSATEFNTVVAEINKKIDIQAGKVLSDNNYSNQDRLDLLNAKAGLTELRGIVEELSAAPGGASSVVSDAERKVGIYRIAGTAYDLYECTFSLTSLPGAGATKDYTLIDEPLGNRVYLSVTSHAITAGDNYYIANYSAEKLYVDADYNTHIIIRCNDAIADAKMLLTIRYVKMDYEKVEFKLTLPAGANKDAVALSFPNLKYGKKFAYSLVVDDDKVDSNKLFFLIHKKWIDAEKNQHFDQVHTTGYTPDKFLEYSDGAGIQKRFTYGVAIFPGMGNAYIDNFMSPTGKEIGKNYPYLVWSEVNRILDFGNEVHFHNVPTDNENDITQLLKGLQAAQNATISETGNGMKILIRPDGNDNYITAGTQFADIVFLTTEGGNHTVNEITANIDLQKGVIFRRNCDYITTENYISRFAGTTDGMWLCDFTHAPSTGMLEGLGQVSETYGSSGFDNIWFATLDEVYEYWFIRKFAVVRKTINSNDVIFSILVPRLKYGRHTDFSVQISNTVAGNTSVTVLTNNIIGLSSASSGTTLLVNLNINQWILDATEKYTAKFEASESSDDEADARYLVSQLRADLQTPFLARLNAGNVPPVLNSVAINSGTTTYDAIVSISVAKTGAVTHYRIGETSDLSSVTWQAYTGTISYTLSAGYGNKTIYVQVKNSNGESSVKSATISYQEQPAVTYTVTARANNAAYGTVTPASQTLAAGGSANVSATANEGYAIESWIGSDASTGVGTASGTASVSNVQADRAIVCNFKSNSTPPSSKKKWILSLGWPWDNIGLDADTGVDKQMGTSAKKQMHTTDGTTLGNMITSNNGVVLQANSTNLPGRKGATTGDNSGPYLDIYMERLISPFSTTNEGELPTLTITISDLPASTYIVRLFSSTIDITLTQSSNKLQYVVNDVVIEKGSSFPVNNTNQLVVFENVAIANGTIVIKLISPENQKGNPINVVEIEEV